MSERTATLVTTIPERCRVCYTCVRECPAKAIRIVGGQAEVVPERCISCGNCVTVCSQNAKQYRDSTGRVRALLASGGPVAAMIAPSFPAEFMELHDYRVLVGMVRRLGFSLVTEVAFGADLVALRYLDIINSRTDEYKIAANCPAVVTYIEKYHPALVSHIANIVSPMAAMAKVVHERYGDAIPIVFIGPCIAKKGEADDYPQDGIADALTFTELRGLFADTGITPDDTSPSQFDPPLGGKGAIFPISRGMLQTVDINEDLTAGNVVVADGRIDFPEAIREFEAKALRDQHLDLLCCDGCIMGPGMSRNGKRFARRAEVARYVRARLAHLDEELWRCEIDRYATLDLTRGYRPNDRSMSVPPETVIREIFERMGKRESKDELNCGACGYDTCREHAVAIHNGLAESEMCLPYTIENLHRYIEELAVSNVHLATTRDALKKQEKLASMGQLAAGIAHEVNNPLGVILLYSNILRDELDKGSALYKDIELIACQADRCKSIVAGLLNFARKSEVYHRSTDVLELVQRAVGSVVIPASIAVTVENHTADPVAEIDPDQMMQVLVNLIKNGVEAIDGSGTIRIGIEGDEHDIRFIVTDTGCGIAKKDQEKLFEPFFTTKAPGKGSGLGLSVSYGIVKMHRGRIQVDSNNDPAAGATGTTFTVILPRRPVIG